MGSIQQAPMVSPVPSLLVEENRRRLYGSKFSEYLCSDYCLSCAYFQSTKGHFGICGDTGSKITYDGSKKGSACAGWRIKTAWVGIEFKLPDPIIRVKPIRRGLFSDLGSTIWGAKIHPDLDLRKVAIHRRQRLKEEAKQIKRKETIEKLRWAVEDFDQWTLSMVRQSFKSTPRITLMRLTEKGVCPRCASRDIVKHGVRHNNVSSNIQRWSCHKCQFHFSETYWETKRRIGNLAYKLRRDDVERAIRLFSEGTSTRKIANIFNAEGMAVSHVALWRYINAFFYRARKEKN